MKTEEKILDYMDGTLNESESGELLHSLSVSPEKRVVLEQHIKLRELTSLAQKPLAIPQALEASMAERFPAIASYNRELSGGAFLIEQTARPSYIGRMVAAVAAFIGQYPVRTGFAVAAASVIAYFALRGGDQKADVALADKSYRIYTSDGTNKTSGDDLQKGNSISSTENSQTTVPKASSSSKTFSVKQHHSGTPSSRTDFSQSIKASERTKVRSTDAANNEHATPNKHDVAPPQEIQNNNKKDVADVGNNMTTANSTNTTSEKKQSDDVNEKTKEYAAITPVTDIRSQNNFSLSENNVHGSRYEQNPFRDKEEGSNSLFAVRIYGSLGQTFINVHQNDATMANRIEGGALLGVDYIANPYISVGVEGGNAAISQLVTQSAVQSNVGGTPSISRVVVNNVVTSGSQFYARGVFHYTFNPYDMIHFEGTAGVGLAFASTSAPLVSGAFFAGYDLTSKLGISAGIAFSGAWNKANAQSSTVPAVTSGSDPIGFVTVNHASATLFTPSYGLRVGLKLKL